MSQHHIIYSSLICYRASVVRLIFPDLLKKIIRMHVVSELKEMLGIKFYNFIYNEGINKNVHTSSLHLSFSNIAYQFKPN